MSKVIGYTLVRHDDRRGWVVSGTLVGRTLEEAQAIHTVYKMEYPLLGAELSIAEIRIIEAPEKDDLT